MSKAAKILWIAADKDGYSIILESSCWYGHILRNHRRQMRHRLFDTRTTIERADRIDELVVNQVKNRVYYKKWIGRDPLGQQYLKVPTQIMNVSTKTSRVLTAFPVPFLP